jgi:S-adenosylmethionine synthetase
MSSGDSAGRLRPAEAVASGHPDKICDAIADTLLEAAVRREPRALVGVEVAVHRDRVFTTGRIAGAALTIGEIEQLVRGRYASLGHGDVWAPDPARLGIVCDLDLGPLVPGEADFRDISDDQSICTGYAVDSAATGWLPPEHWLAHAVIRRLERLRQERPDLRLGPDAKAAVLCVGRPGQPMGLETATVSLQQKIGADEIATRRAVVEAVRSALSAAQSVLEIPRDLADRVLVNGAGNFECGGPMGDNGLSGKKLVVDAYGPRVPIGGGALSGKDFFKVDRAGAIAARRLATVMVRSGASREILVELLWRPGDREARVAAVTGADGEAVDPAPWLPLVDFSLHGSGTRWPSELAALGVATPIADLATLGHFGGGQPWEPAPEPALGR